jgi:hypothetical protein
MPKIPIDRMSETKKVVPPPNSRVATSLSWCGAARDNDRRPRASSTADFILFGPVDRITASSFVCHRTGPKQVNASQVDQYSAICCVMKTNKVWFCTAIN